MVSADIQFCSGYKKSAYEISQALFDFLVGSTSFELVTPAV